MEQNTNRRKCKNSQIQTRQLTKILTNNANVMKKRSDTSNGYQVIVDSGAAMAIAGLSWFKKYYQEMPKD